MKGRIIGLCGPARSGKDTVAGMIREILFTQRKKEDGWYTPAKKVQVAGPLKLYCQALFDWDERHTDGELKDVVDERYGFAPRKAMQFLGYEFAQATWPGIYSETAAREAKKLSETGRDVVVTDVRTLADVEALKRVGAEIWRITREKDNALGDTANHATETEMDTDEFLYHVDVTILNDGTLEDLREGVEEMLYDSEPWS